jgi:anti-sigma regulatory factor (Ser/Thr protein kinase)
VTGRGTGVGRTVSCTLAPDVRSVSHARHFLADTLSSWRLGHLVDTAQVVISELATNAVLHARTLFTVTVERMPDGVLLRVNDGDALIPHSGATPLRAEEATDGRGLVLVDQLADGWGAVADGHGGKAVWALLSAAEPSGPIVPAARSPL